MESISNNLAGTDILLSRMQSDSAVKKAGGQEGQASEGIGNMLNSFSNVLKEQLGHINQLQAEAGEAKRIYATGGDIELHNVLIAGEKASLSMQLALQVRNKMVAAYQEISHMSV